MKAGRRDDGGELLEEAELIHHHMGCAALARAVQLDGDASVACLAKLRLGDRRFEAIADDAGASREIALGRGDARVGRKASVPAGLCSSAGGEALLYGPDGPVVVDAGEA